MIDIIQLLPDSVANQIAAGEVIQRPASAVKELLENAIDAGADNILLHIKDAGKTMIHVIDNGSGMSVTDARMSFERHATSKIKQAADLFNIRTMGFRGEALASIAAIAQVEMKSRREEDEVGTQLVIEGSEVLSQEPCSCPKGTSFSIKNLFYNIPARRNFLKSDSVETRHVIDEFQRVALAYPNLAFSMYQNDNEVFRLPKGNLRQRIVNIFGNNYNERLVPMAEETNLINLNGFIGKPEFAKRTRGEQFFFVNNRFIRDAYLNHAVINAMEGMLLPGSFPSYFIFIDVDPQRIDINIHPTKTEIKFDDDRSVYAILKAAVKRSLGQYSIMPTLDFDQEASLNIPALPRGTMPARPGITVNTDYNPFDNPQQGQSNKSAHNWQQLYQGMQNDTGTLDAPIQQSLHPKDELQQQHSRIFQVGGKYIVAAVRNGLAVIDQHSAHKRILFDQLLEEVQNRKALSQKKLFPRTIEVSPSDKVVLDELLPHLEAHGFDMSEFGNNAYIIHGVPVEMEKMDEEKVIESLIDKYKHNDTKPGADISLVITRMLAGQIAVRKGITLTPPEMINIVEKLFACENPYLDPDGNNTLLMLPTEELESKIGKS